jgi:hypothetical protein
MEWRRVLDLRNIQEESRLSTFFEYGILLRVSAYRIFCGDTRLEEFISACHDGLPIAAA